MYGTEDKAGGKRRGSDRSPASTDPNPEDHPKEAIIMRTEVYRVHSRSALRNNSAAGFRRAPEERSV